MHFGCTVGLAERRRASGNGAYRHGRFTQAADGERKRLREAQARMKSLMRLAAMRAVTPE
jgi:transposase